MLDLLYARIVYDDNQKQVESMIDSDWFRENVYDLGLPIIEQYPEINVDNPELMKKYCSKLDYIGTVGFYMAKELANNFAYFFKVDNMFVDALNSETAESVATKFLTMDKKEAIIMDRDFQLANIGRDFWPTIENEPDVRKKVIIFETMDFNNSFINFMTDWIKYNINCSFNYDFNCKLELK